MCSLDGRWGHVECHSQQWGSKGIGMCTDDVQRGPRMLGLGWNVYVEGVDGIGTSGLASSRGRPRPLAKRALNTFAPTASRGPKMPGFWRLGGSALPRRGSWRDSGAACGENAPQEMPNLSRPRACIGACSLALPEDASPERYTVNNGTAQPNALHATNARILVTG